MKQVSDWQLKFEAQRDLSLLPGVKALAKDVHLHLVFHCNIKDGRCFPSEERLAGYVGRSTRSVRDALKNLEACGAITICARGGRNGTNQYDLHLLERKKAAYRPEEIGITERKVPADKHIKKHNKEQGHGDLGPSQFATKSGTSRLKGPPLAYELVTCSKKLDVWYDLVSSLNIGSPNELTKLTRSECGYRLPSLDPDNETGGRPSMLAYFLRVRNSRGRCFD